ncbi:MAG: hypothetical protein WEB06_21575 [Actinomycetota bacterium]
MSPTPRERRIGRLGVLVVSAALVAITSLASCAARGLAFRIDHRLEILSPSDRVEVRLPFELRWRARDFPVGAATIGGNGNYFAVFVDRAPMGPNQPFRALADTDCKRTRGCPDEQWLADHQIYLTTSTSLTITSLPDVLPGNTRPGVKEPHEITIVLVNATDQRIGESAFTIEFFFVRDR